MSDDTIIEPGGVGCNGDSDLKGMITRALFRFLKF